jgi:hypothetical protein
MKSIVTKLTLFCLSFTVVSLLLTHFANAKIELENLVAMWLLDEGKGTVVEDSSGNGHDGNVMGDLRWINGEFGEAIDFSGGASVQVPDHESLNFGTDSFTVLLWFNFSTPQDWNRLVREREPSGWGTGNYGWEIQTQGTQIHWSLDDKAGNHKKTTYPNGGNGEWHHTAMVVDRDRNLLVSYMDGADEKTANIANMGSVTDILPITFGGGYAGAIDEIAIFKGTLELNDIVDIMNKGLSEAVKPAAVSPSAKLAATWGWVRHSR